MSERDQQIAQVLSDLDDYIETSTGDARSFAKYTKSLVEIILQLVRRISRLEQEVHERS